MQEWTLAPSPRGVLLRICEWPGPEPPVVILHGFLEQGAAWDAVAHQLGRRVVAPDQRGHGRSGHVGSGGFYHFWDYVSDVDALVDHLGGPVDLVGHSMGGTVACLFAGCRPDAVRRLVLVEGLGPPDTTETAVDRAIAFLDHRRRPPSHGTFADAHAAAERMRKFNPDLPLDVAEGLAARTSRPVDGGHTWTWDALHRARSPVPFSAALFVRFLDRIEAPTLLIQGGTSWFRVPDEAERTTHLRDATTATVPDAGHMIHHDAPDALAALIRDHLDAA